MSVVTGVYSVGRWGYLLTEKDKDRFWRKVDRTTTPDGCWPFIGYLDQDGYGHIWFNGQMRLAHHVALELVGFIIPAEFLQIRHYICHNPPCCRPSHLRIGTKQENEDDKVAVDRQARGERAGGAKLDPTKVREIRRLYLAAAPRHGLRAQLARQFDITLQSINNILNGKTWRHVT